LAEPGDSNSRAVGYAHLDQLVDAGQFEDSEPSFMRSFFEGPASLLTM
jgi:hypothetical protein